MDFSKQHLNRVKTLFWRHPSIYLDNLVCVALHVFLLQRMLPLSSLVAFLFFLAFFLFFYCLYLFSYA